MSRFEALIAELCPGGVRYLPLAEVAEYSRTRVDASSLDATNFVGVDNLVANKGGRIDSTYPPNTARLTAYKAGDILLGNIRPYLRKVWLATHGGGCSGDVLAIRLAADRRESMAPDFLYYLLSSDAFFAYNMQHAKGAKMPRGSKDAIMQYRVPMPPLEVQREIVRVLNQFTQLEAELEAELEARQCQYSHYRNALLAFDDSVPRVALGQLIRELRTGLNPRKNFTLNSPGASNYYITVRELAGFSVAPSDRTDRVDDAGLARIQARSRLQEGDVLFSGTGTIGRTALISEQPRDWNIKEGVYALTPIEEMMLPRFLIQVLHSEEVRSRILGAADGSTVASVSMAALRRILLPVPSLADQERIIAILDSFDELANDPVTGLPAEIAARRRQFEHYRNKLLSFEEAAA